MPALTINNTLAELLLPSSRQSDRLETPVSFADVMSSESLMTSLHQQVALAWPRIDNDRIADQGDAVTENIHPENDSVELVDPLVIIASSGSFTHQDAKGPEPKADLVAVSTPRQANRNRQAIAVFADHVHLSLTTAGPMISERAAPVTGEAVSQLASDVENSAQSSPVPALPADAESLPRAVQATVTAETETVPLAAQLAVVSTPALPERIPDVNSAGETSAQTFESEPLNKNPQRSSTWPQLPADAKHAEPQGAISSVLNHPALPADESSSVADNPGQATLIGKVAAGGTQLENKQIVTATFDVVELPRDSSVGELAAKLQVKDPGHVEVQAKDPGHVQLPDSGHAQPQAENRRHVHVQPPDSGHVQVQAEKHWYVQVQAEDPGHVQVQAENRRHVQAPTDKANLSMKTSIAASEPASGRRPTDSSETSIDEPLDLGVQDGSAESRDQREAATAPFRTSPGRLETTPRPPGPSFQSIEFATSSESPIKPDAMPVGPKFDFDSVSASSQGKAIQSADPVADLRPLEITKQVMTVIKDAVQSADTPSVRTVSLELQPEELGHIKIHIEQTAESITTQIIATESLSSDLLLNHKDALLEALADLGFDRASVDISHQQQEQPNQRQNVDPQATEKGLPQNDSDSSGRNRSASTSNGLNIVV